MITPVLINRLSWRTYIIFMAANFAFVPVIYFFFPETSNFSLEEVDQFFTSGENPVKVAKRMTKELKAGRLVRAGQEIRDDEKAEHVITTKEN